MTDPADMDGAALGEAVMRAMNWVPANPEIPQGDWLTPMDDGLRHVRALDFTGPGKWAAFGEVCVEIYERGGSVEARAFADDDEAFNEIVVWLPECEEGGVDTLYAERANAPNDWPAALAVAFLRAVAGEGRA